jgi:hypothetical protein
VLLGHRLGRPHPPSCQGLACHSVLVELFRRARDLRVRERGEPEKYDSRGSVLEEGRAGLLREVGRMVGVVAGEEV